MDRPDSGGDDLTTAVWRMLPTPQARDGVKGSIRSPSVAQDRMDSGRRNLDDAIALLPTPTSRDHKGPNQRGDETCLHGALLPATTGGTTAPPSPAGKPSSDDPPPTLF
jgi:hypothetical protein